ncbi:MAG TPA: RNA-binding S4 domain-containing protein [Candidatus Avirikenella pullistercoris]|nr:RNA-binding S4 domain-containing protein [Candidatus Avirikenella pullistercoris]
MEKNSSHTVRIDKWLWAIRAYKTRSLAAEACKSNKISVNGANAKPSREIKAGDIICVKKMPVIYTFRVIEPIGNRQGAKNVHLYAENLTPQEELDKLTMHLTLSIQRDKGTGRPTKKDRREIDELMNEFFFDDEFDKEI